MVSTCYTIHSARGLSRSRQIRGMLCRWISCPWSTPNGTRGDAFTRARSLTATRQIPQPLQKRSRVLYGPSAIPFRRQTAESIVNRQHLQQFPRPRPFNGCLKQRTPANAFLFHWIIFGLRNQPVDSDGNPLWIWLKRWVDLVL